VNKWPVFLPTIIDFQLLRCFKHNLKSFVLWSILGMFASKSCRYAPVSFAISVSLPSVHLSACHNSITAEQIFMKLDTAEFYKNLSTHSSFGWSQAIIMGTLYEDVHAFLHMEVNGWGIPSQWIPVLGIPSQPHSHVGESSMMTSSYRQTGANTSPTHWSLTSENWHHWCHLQRSKVKFWHMHQNC
jgi:hypothetical protein